jgi:peptidoglycan/xylan/chitin deacetylase (PgdA/CDA1 family)
MAGRGSGSCLGTALALYQSGVLARWARRPSRRTTPISVMYHSVDGVGLSPDIVVSEANSQSHIQYLRRHYHLMSLQETVDLVEAQRPIPRNAAVVTLDDSFRDNYQTELPILKQYECPATLFVAVEPLDTGRKLWSQSLRHWLQTTQEKQLRLAWRSKTATDHVEKLLSLQSGAERSQAPARIKAVAGALRVDERQDFLRLVARELRANNGVDASAGDTMLTWSHVREMHGSGVNIGSHTVTHPQLSGLAPAEVRRELIESRTRLERELDAEIPLFVYPFGGPQDYTEQTKLAVKAAGYKAACVGEDAAARDAFPDLLALPRLYVPDDPVWRFALRLLFAARPSRLIEWLLAD